MVLEVFNDVEHMQEQNAEVTAEPDVQAAPR
jgi:hypothetical protein